MSRWLFSAPADGAMFLGTALASAALAWAGHRAGFTETPLWAWVLLVLCIDVAHVWSTLFKVYLDKAELQRRPVLYAGAPILAFALGVAAYASSPGTFWRVFAYVAAWHFVRQQAGWMALYGRRAGSAHATLKWDQAAIYAATLGPLVWWHSALPRPFAWFIDGDFVPGLPQHAGTAALALHGVVLVAWLSRQLFTERHLGKVLLLLATWLAWFGGIVLANSDFVFTVMNVALHGVPYAALLYRYAKGRHAENGYGRFGLLLRAGLPGFLLFLLALAFAEELLWDRLVWHERPQVFGPSAGGLDESLLLFIVPLLSLPQATHYLLDGFIWRGRENPELSTRLGWAPRPPLEPS